SNVAIPFRSRMTAAPLKRLRYAQGLCERRTFRSRMTAAPLKPSESAVKTWINSFPQSNDRGPIEAACARASIERECSFPQSNDCGPIEAQPLLDDVKLAIAFPQSNDCGPIEARVKVESGLNTTI